MTATTPTRQPAKTPTKAPLSDRIVSAGVWTATGLLVLPWTAWMGLVYLATAHRDPGRYAVGRWFRRCGVVVSTINPFWRFRVTGVRITDPRRPYVVVSNHESMADIFLGCHVPWEMKWLSKQEVFRIPFMGWMMRMAGDIPVRRGERNSRRDALEACRDRLGKRVSVMILPEGTRSGTGELLPFKTGAFRLAIEEQVPVLPVAIAGTRDALPKGSLAFGRAHAELRVLEPVETAGMTAADAPALRDGVKGMIAEAREKLRADLLNGAR